MSVPENQNEGIRPGTKLKAIKVAKPVYGDKSDITLHIQVGQIIEVWNATLCNQSGKRLIIPDKLGGHFDSNDFEVVN